MSQSQVVQEAIEGIRTLLEQLEELEPRLLRLEKGYALDGVRLSSLTKRMEDLEANLASLRETVERRQLAR